MLVARLIAGPWQSCCITPCTTRAASVHAAANSSECEPPVKGSSELISKSGCSFLTAALHQRAFYSSVYIAKGVAREPVFIVSY
jgi:hypothetical protein